MRCRKWWWSSAEGRCRRAPSPRSPPTPTIIAADSGLDHAVAAGLRPDVLVGDLDSISAHGQMWAYAHELEIDEHPTDKDATDTELALACARRRPRPPTCSCSARPATGFDHALGTLAALGNPRLARFEIDPPACSTTPRVHVIHPGRTVLDRSAAEHAVLAARAARRRATASTVTRGPMAARPMRCSSRSSTRGISNETTGSARRRRRRRRPHRGGPMKRSASPSPCLAALVARRVRSDASSRHRRQAGRRSRSSPTTRSRPKDTPLEHRARRVHAPTPASRSTVVTAGDAGTMVTKAVLTAGNPEGDVMWGVDNTLLSAALDGDVFTKYEPNDWHAIDTNLTGLVPGHELTPVDFGDVCVNYDIGLVRRPRDLDPPSTLDDLRRPEYKDLLVVENPSTSSPGLAFLLATIAAVRRRTAGRSTGPRCAPTASRSSTLGHRVLRASSAAPAARPGKRPLVVSYGSSPPAEVIFADPPRTDAPTGVIDATCFRQVEFAGVLRGTKHAERGAQAGRLPDQRALPERAAADPVRLPGPHRRGAARGVHQVHRRARDPLSLRPGRRSPPTGRSGRTSGPRSCCAEPRLTEPAPGGSSHALPRRRSCSSPGSTPGRWPRCCGRPRIARSATAHRSVTSAEVVWFTMWQAVVSTVLTLVVGLPPAYVLARYSFRGRRAAAGRGDRAVRAADRGGRRGVPGAAARARGTARRRR